MADGDFVPDLEGFIDGYVDAVNADGTINTEEYNWSNDGAYHTRISFNWSAAGVQFIHVKDTTPPPPPSADNSQFGAVHGDFNGDGKMDAAMLYDWGNNNTALLMMNGSSTGLHFAGQVWSAITNSGFTMTWSRAKLVAGDFNGDGYSDLGILYDWGNNNTAMLLMSGSSTGLHWVGQIWSAQGNGGFTMIWDRVKLVAGDFNGDGYSDLGILYDWGNNNTALLMMNGTTGGPSFAGQAWSAAGNVTPAMSLDRSKLVTGDFNGDGKYELGVLYDYGNNNTAMLLFNGSSSGPAWVGQIWNAQQDSGLILTWDRLKIA